MMNHKNIMYPLIESAPKHFEKTAIIDYQKGLFGAVRYQEFSFRRVLTDIAYTAARLKDLGFKKGDRIIVFTPMSYKLYIIILSIFSIGAVATFIDAWADKKRLADACNVVTPRGFIGSAKAQILRIVPEIRNIPIKVLDTSIIDRGHNSGTHLLEPAAVNGDDEALVTLTTGSTGLPKGAKRTHGLLLEQMQILTRHVSYNDASVVLTALPVFVFLNLPLGTTSVLPIFNPARPTDFNPQEIIQQMTHLGVTISVGSPAFMDKIADALIEKGRTYPLESLYTGGAPVFKSLGRKLKMAFPQARVEVVYGSTEAEPMSTIDLEETLRADSARGLPLGRKDDAIAMKILKPTPGPVTIQEGQNIETYLADSGAVGEIIVSGIHVLREYLGDAQAFKENKIIDKDSIWHRTGDAGCIDAAGNIFLHGRVKNPIHSFDRIVYALPYEQRLMEIPGVNFAAVMEVEGHVFVAIEPRTGLKKAAVSELLNQARLSLHDIKTDSYLILPKIPRDPRHNSKVNFSQLEVLLKQYRLAAVKRHRAPGRN